MTLWVRSQTSRWRDLPAACVKWSSTRSSFLYPRGNLTQETATRIFGTPGSISLVAIRQDFSGAFSGRALLIFPETNSLELVRAAVGRHLPLEDIVDVEDEALAEIGNITVMPHNLNAAAGWR